MNILQVCVINTGGTISCTGNPLVPMSAQNFATACKRLLNPIFKQQFPEVELTYSTELKFDSPTGTLDSTNLQPSDWCLIAEEILKHYESYNAWVVLHGTDTMAYTASALPFLLTEHNSTGFAKIALDKSVILTGSQVPMFTGNPQSPEELRLRYNTDAYQNVCGAIAAALSGIPEVCLYFDGDLYRGNRSVKSNANEFKAFSSPNYPVLGEYGIEFRVYPDRILPPPDQSDNTLSDKDARKCVYQKVQSIMSHLKGVPVIQLMAFPAWYETAKGNDSASSALIANMIKDSIKGEPPQIRGLILESYGEGNFPSGDPYKASEGAVYKALAEAKAKGVIVVDCTQVIQGEVNDGAYASGAWLQAVGALNAKDMTPITALAKLTILLAGSSYGPNVQSPVENLFQLNLCGEMDSPNRLTPRKKAILYPREKITTIEGGAYLENAPLQGPVIREANRGKIIWRMVHPQEIVPKDMPGYLKIGETGIVEYIFRNGTYSARITPGGHHPRASWVLELTQEIDQGDKKTMVVLTLLDIREGYARTICMVDLNGGKPFRSTKTEMVEPS